SNPKNSSHDFHPIKTYYFKKEVEIMKKTSPTHLIAVALILSIILITTSSTITATTHKQSSRILLELHTSSIQFEKELARDFPTVEIIERFDRLINGIAIEGKPTQLERILEHEAVKQVYPIMTYSVTPENLQVIEPADMPLDDPNPDTDYTGKGVKVGIIDTGIGYTHPDLATNFQGGYDLIDFDDDP